MQHEKLRDALAAKGWRIADNTVAARGNLARWYAWWPKRNTKLRACECNEKPPSVCIEPSVFELDEQLHGTVTFRLVGQFGGRWFDLRCYSVPLSDCIRTIPSATAALERAWMALEAA